MLRNLDLWYHNSGVSALMQRLPDGKASACDSQWADQRSGHPLSSSLIDVRAVTLRLPPCHLHNPAR